MPKVLSVVVPCFNEEAVIHETFKQLVAECSRICRLHDMSYEIIFVNDGSKDNTLSLLHALHAGHTDSVGQIKVLALARNFGHQIALSAGLKMATGHAIVAIDADLQDPPEVIEQMVERWKMGVDVVYGMRSRRDGESAFKLFTAKCFYKLLRKLTRVEIPLDTGDFRLVSRRALDVFNQMPERQRFIRGMIPWIGFKQEAVLYNRSKRFAGETKYPFTKMLRLALDGLTSFSNAPLQTAYLTGFFVAALCVLYAIVIIVRKFFIGYPVEGWSSLMVIVLFLGAVQLITVGILGDYIGRIYEEVKKRPLFIIDEESSRH